MWAGLGGNGASLCSIQCHGGGSKRSGGFISALLTHTIMTHLTWAHDLGLSLVCIHLTITYLHVISMCQATQHGGWVLGQNYSKAGVEIVSNWGLGTGLQSCPLILLSQSNPKSPYSRQKEEYQEHKGQFFSTATDTKQHILKREQKQISKNL